MRAALPIAFLALVTACGSPDAPANQQSEPAAVAEPAFVSEENLVSEEDIRGWQPFDPSKAGGRVLLFDFPDGARGGYGAIRGMAYVDPTTAPERPEAGIARCAGTNVRVVPLLSHHHFVSIESGPRDLEIVRCLQRSTSLHFSVSQRADPMRPPPEGEGPGAGTSE